MKKLHEKALEYARLYADLLLGNDWVVNVVVCDSNHMPRVQWADSAPLASSSTRSGERKISIVVNKEVPWNEFPFDLELTMCHEVIHAVVEACGSSDAGRALRKALVDGLQASVSVFDLQEILFEEAIDVLASKIVALKRGAE